MANSSKLDRIDELSVAVNDEPIAANAERKTVVSAEPSDRNAVRTVSRRGLSADLQKTALTSELGRTDARKEVTDEQTMWIAAANAALVVWIVVRNAGLTVSSVAVIAELIAWNVVVIAGRIGWIGVVATVPQGA